MKKELLFGLIFIILIAGVFAIEGNSSSYSIRTDIGFGGVSTNASSTSYTTTFISGSAPSSAEEDSSSYYARGGILGRIFSSATCGNNLKEVGETCDGTDLNSQTCALQVAGTTGTLSCASDCGSFVTSSCSASAVTPGSTGGGSSGESETIIEHECEEDSDCGEKKYCFEYECYDFECSSNGDCIEGETCYSGRCTKLFDTEILEIISPEVTGEPFRFHYLIKGMAKFNNDVVVKYWIENKEGEISSGQDTFYLGSFETVEKESELYLPREFTSGVYTFNVAVTYGNYKAVSQRTIQIDSEQQIVSYSPVLKNWKTYLFPFVFIIGLILIGLVIYFERKKLKKMLVVEEKFFKKYKISFGIIVFVFLVWLVLHLLKAKGIISVPWMYDYYIFGLYTLGKVLYVIAGVIVLVLVILSVIYANKKYKNFKSKPRISKPTVFRTRKVNPKVKKIAKPNVKHKNKREGLISRWRKKGYDTNVLGRKKKKKGSKEKMINELKKWKNQGYDVHAIS